MSDVENGSENTTPEAITNLTVKGFKSLARETSIDIRPLTLLAGANSSGKSSAMQPLLLMKQTLEAPFDPGPLLLDGPNVSFRSASNFVTAGPGREESLGLVMKAGLSAEREYAHCEFVKGETGLDLLGNTRRFPEGQIKLYPSCDFTYFQESTHGIGLDKFTQEHVAKWQVVQDRFRLRGKLYQSLPVDGSSVVHFPSPLVYDSFPGYFSEMVEDAIHVPGLRDNPSRTYKTTAVRDRFPGTFDTYVASVIQSWQREDDARLPALVEQLRHMGLTRDVSAERINDTQVELRVAQEPIGSSGDARVINVADVGIGVSQVLPVLVAMLVADPGQLVYIEQPEIHLHPRAQARLADAIIEASNRGVRVVIETHSQLLLLAIQTRIAENEIDPEKVMLHWFTRDEQGVTSVASREPDEKGAFGDWPEDFSEVEMEWQNRYLDAAEKHLFG